MRLKDKMSGITSPSDLPHEHYRAFKDAQRRYEESVSRLFRLLVGAHAGAVTASLSFIGLTVFSNTYSHILLIPLGIFTLGIIFIGLNEFSEVSQNTKEMMDILPGYSEATQALMPDRLQKDDFPHVSNALATAPAISIIAYVRAILCFLLGVVSGFITILVTL